MAHLEILNIHGLQNYIFVISEKTFNFEYNVYFVIVW